MIRKYSQVCHFYDFQGRLYRVQIDVVMMPQKMLEQPLNWPSISLSMAQKRLVSFTCVFAFLKIMGLKQIVTDYRLLLLPFFTEMGV